jgi:hypothetical protein
VKANYLTATCGERVLNIAHTMHVLVCREALYHFLMDDIASAATFVAARELLDAAGAPLHDFPTHTPFIYLCVYLFRSSSKLCFFEEKRT